jgi:phage terminase large subunit-like protein
LLGGRGAGKTATAARYLHDHVHGPPCLNNVPGGHWVSIIGPTLGDAATSCVYGPSGLRAHDPGVKIRQTAGGATVRWSNGAEGKLFGAHTPEDVERLRSGGNRCVVWAEELAAWRYLDECWQHMRYGLRVGPWPHVIVSTTPKARKLIKDLHKKGLDPENTEVVMTTATTEDNPHLDQRVKKALFDDYGGTRLGQQELYAKILEEIEGALWKPEMIDLYRVDFQTMPPLDRLVIGVDPGGNASGETGIVACGAVGRWDIPRMKDLGLHDKSHGFVLDDQTCAAMADKWAKATLAAFKNWQANIVVAEINNGFDMVQHTLRTYNSALPIREVHASRGKAKRAEPISTLYEQGRVHHVGIFGKLEDQMCSFDPNELNPQPEDSPDRMDALVWALTDLMVDYRTMTTSQNKDDRLKGRR